MVNNIKINMSKTVKMITISFHRLKNPNTKIIKKIFIITTLVKKKIKIMKKKLKRKRKKTKRKREKERKRK